MRVPPLLLAAGLAFWGWRSGNYAAAAALAALAEAPGFVKLRVDLQHAQFARIADLCTVLFIALVLWLFVSLEPPRTARAVLTSMLWLPAVLMPVLAAQRFSSAGRIPLSALFRYLRRLRERDPEFRDPEIDLAPIYFAICVVAAGIPNQRDVYFYAGVVLLAAWALAPARPSRVRLASWALALLAASALGFAAQAGLGRAQAAFQDWMTDWITPRLAVDPYSSTTDMGAVGRLKLHDLIVMRVYAPAPPGLLHRASFTHLSGTTWVARNAPMAPLQPEADGLSWPLERGATKSSARIVIRLEWGKALLALPAGTLRISGMAAASARRNALGAIQADFGGEWAPYTVETGDALADYAAPRSEDLQLPERERAAFEALAARLGLRALAPAQAVQRVREHFSEFSYSTYLEAAPAAGTSALEDFLLRSRSGHCEYFAAATTLLLRAAGIPARYATGFAAYEYSALEKAYLVRARHAHAWTRAYVGERWVEIDTTPPSWAEEEARAAPLWQGLTDFVRWAQFRWSHGGPVQAGAGWGLALAMLVAILAWRMLRGRRLAAAARAGSTAPRRFPGGDSEFYSLAKRLPPRAVHETAGAWLARIGASIDPAMLESLARVKAMHERYRFDPRGIDAGARARLRDECRALEARLESTHG